MAWCHWDQQGAAKNSKNPTWEYSQQGLTLTPLCSWVPPHSDTQKPQHSSPEQHFCAHSKLWLQQIQAHEGTMQQGSIRD